METFEIGSSFFEAIWWIAIAGGIAFAALCLTAISARKRHREKARSRTLVGGKVEFGRGESSPFKVTVEDWLIEDRGIKAWEPQRRTAQVHPFVLVTDKGERIRIVPAARDLLLMHSETLVQQGEARRTRCTELRAGEHIWISGTVRSGAEEEVGASAYRNQSVAVLSIASEEAEPPLRLYREQPGNEFNAPIRRNALNTLGCFALLCGIVFLVEPFNYNSQEKDCVVDSALLVKPALLPDFYRVTCQAGTSSLKINLREAVAIGDQLPCFTARGKLVVGAKAMFSATWLLALLLPIALLLWKLARTLKRGPKLWCDEDA